MKQTNPFQKNQELTLDITGVTSEGQGVGRSNGVAFFVPFALPGETVRAHIIKVEKRFCIAKIVEILNPSEHRVAPFCEAYEKCGGCALMHMDYAEQLKTKTQIVKDCLERLGGFADIEVQDTIGMDDPWRYRNKGSFPIGFADGTAAFPNAHVYVSKAERTYWVDEVKNANVISALELYAGRVHEFEFGDEVMPGVTALDSSGHTPGHVSFMVEDEEEKLLVIGDLVHFVRIQLPVPEVCVTYDVDPVKAAAARKRIFDLACENGIPVAGMHIPFPGTLRLKKSGGGYEAY